MPLFLHTVCLAQPFGHLSCKATLCAWCSNQRLLCLPQSGSLFSCCVEDLENSAACSFACFRMYLKQLSASSGSNKSSKAAIFTFISMYFFQVVFTATTFLSGLLQILRCSSRSACHCLSFLEENEFCCSICGVVLTSSSCALSSLWCSSHRVLRTTKNSLGPSELKVPKIFRPFLSFASSKICPPSVLHVHVSKPTFSSRLSLARCRRIFFTSFGQKDLTSILTSPSNVKVCQRGHLKPRSSCIAYHCSRRSSYLLPLLHFLYLLHPRFSLFMMPLSHPDPLCPILSSHSTELFFNFKAKGFHDPQLQRGVDFCDFTRRIVQYNT